LETVTLLTIVVFAFSVGLLYWFGRFTIKLIKQHYDIYPLLYELEEQEKKKK